MNRQTWVQIDENLFVNKEDAFSVQIEERTQRWGTHNYPDWTAVYIIVKSVMGAEVCLKIGQYSHQLMLNEDIEKDRAKAMYDAKIKQIEIMAKLGIKINE